eukprot:scaffold1954_cov268-Pinguiococcus_pyrenoidosus.AAC.177
METLRKFGAGTRTKVSPCPLPLAPCILPLASCPLPLGPCQNAQAGSRSLVPESPPKVNRQK